MLNLKKYKLMLAIYLMAYVMIGVRRILGIVSMLMFAASIVLIFIAFLDFYLGLLVEARSLALVSYILFTLGILIQVGINIGKLHLYLKGFKSFLVRASPPHLRLRSFKALNIFLVLIISSSLTVSIALYLLGYIALSKSISIYAYTLLALMIVFNIAFRIVKYFGVLRIKNYFRFNWGAPFIIVFMALLVAAAGFLSLGFEVLANDVAVYAYYFLVLGVILQLVCYFKYGGECADR